MESERDILISSIRKSNLPRFLSEDTPLFINIMKDLFPKMVSNEQKSKELQVSVTDTCRILYMYFFVLIFIIFTRYLHVT